jgi:hypothetical protein
MWSRGKHSGNYRVHKNGKYKARIMNNNIAYCKITETEEEAKEWLNEVSEEFGTIRNKYRITPERHLEVQLTHNQIMLCDLEDLPIVENIVWHCRIDKNNKYSNNSTLGKFHRVIKPWRDDPEWAEVDHINGNGLDNRRSNLRDGSGTINANNHKLRSDNASGKTGTHYSEYHRCWRVQWFENGKRKSKSFRVCDNSGEKIKGNNHMLSRTYEEAKQLAEDFRKEIDIKFNINNGYR